MNHEPTTNLDSPIETALPIARRVLPKLKRLGIVTLRDLLWHIPNRYEDFSKIIPITSVKPDQSATVQGKILDIKNSRTWKKRMMLTEAVIEDLSGALKVVWFNQPFIAQRLTRGTLVSLSGKATYAHDALYLSNPAYEIIRGAADGKPAKTDALHTAGFVAMYPETAGLTSRWLRFLIGRAFQTLPDFTDPIPQDTLRRQKLFGLRRALSMIHFPQTLAAAQAAKRRLIFDELFLLQLGALRERLKLTHEKAPAIGFDIDATRQFLKGLPFELTLAQKKATWEILQDLAKPVPMNRLLEGEVGSGKTVVAAVAIWACLKDGYQIAVMAPTEILARQHFATLQKFLPGVPLGLCLAAERRNSEGTKLRRQQFIEAVAKEQTSVVVGTHALIQKDLIFPKLALVIIDEQHRFGVEQRAQLSTGNRVPTTGQKVLPHFLSMTATPIPRTLALTMYGDLDISILDELPKGRQRIETRIIPPAQRTAAYQFIREEVGRGRQAFVVCPRIEHTANSALPDSRYQIRGNWDDAKAVLAEYEKLSQEVFPDLRIAMLHGKMKSKEKETAMNKFLAREYDVLVSTSVVEVGVDVPNATIMMIEGTEHFGLAQLHQFRGRVGRSDHQSYCLLLADSPAKTANQRMRAILTATSGFELAEQDLRIRGPGDFYGLRQAGVPDLTMASLDNLEFIREARKEAEEVLAHDPELTSFPELARHLQAFRTKVHFE